MHDDIRVVCEVVDVLLEQREVLEEDREESGGLDVFVVGSRFPVASNGLAKGAYMHMYACALTSMGDAPRWPCRIQRTGCLR